MKKLQSALWSFYGRVEKRYLLGLLFLTLGLAAMELASAGAFFFFTSIIADAEMIFRHRYLSGMYRSLGFHSSRHFLLFLGVIVFLVLVVRGLLSVANLYFQSRFSAHMRSALSDRILKTYMTLPYESTLASNSAILSKHLLVEVPIVVACITQTLSLVTEAIVVATLVAVMIYVDPRLVSVIAVAMATTVVVIVKYTRHRLSSLGRELEQCNADMFKAVSEALQGLKDIKVFRVEEFFRGAFNRPLFRTSDLSVTYELISGAPGMVMNLLAFSSLLAVLLYLIFTQGDLLKALPLVAVIAFAVQRLLPSATKIYNGIAMMRKYEPGVFIIKQKLEELNVSAQDKSADSKTLWPLKFEKRLRLENVSYSYPGALRPALRGITLEIQRNTAVGIVGKSGSGKSTLVDVLLGLLPVAEGRIYCDDVELTEERRPALNRLIGYVPQVTFLLDNTLRANIAFGIPQDEIDDAKVRRAIDIAQLTPLVAELPLGLDTRIGERGARISGGQRQRVGIARALYHDPEILILDEATSALDTAMESEFNGAVRQLMGAKTLIIVAHRLSSLDICDRLVLMKEGGDVETEGTFDDLLRSNDEFRRLYGLAERVEP